MGQHTAVVQSHELEAPNTTTTACCHGQTETAVRNEQSWEVNQPFDGLEIHLLD